MKRKNNFLEKQNNIIFIIEILVFGIVGFLFNWYKDELVAKISIFYILLELILIIIWCKLFLITKNKFKSQNKVIKYLTFSWLIFILLINFIDFRLTKTKIELACYMDERMEIINLVKNNQLEYYSDKNIKLPKYKYVSQDGEIYVYQNGDEQVISFWVNRGMQNGSVELIFSSQDEQLIKNVKNDGSIKNIKKLKKHWYFVITN